ncbi:FkbM family methyltransferase [Verrucomicrobia bacterium]|nr:FkbM family methyltransferase [Verrucomicrobiota bacterium]
MKSFLQKLFRRPEFLFRPTQLFRRILWEIKRPKKKVTLKLPWGLTMNVSPEDRIGASIIKTGTYDTAILECLYRLTDHGETCLDIGANFGLMSGILARASGPRGKVIAFEAHPEIAKELEKITAEWKSNHQIASIQIENAAVSDQNGEAELTIPESFHSNMGSSKLAEHNSRLSFGKSLKIRTVQLDHYFEQSKESIGTCKIDIEGHEKSALHGAKKILKEQRIRDIIYEDHSGYPSEVGTFLESFGYEIFLIRKGLFKPLLMNPGTTPYELPNYLATLSPQRAKGRISSIGYKILRKI